jgi:diguanylate cyclase (GGDEF)-like protein
MGWLSYRNNLRVLQEKIAKELTSITSQTSRELDLWLKERHYEIKVFASSYEISENLERISGERPASSEGRPALDRLAAYLTSVKQRFADYVELAVLDPTGAVVATSAPAAGGLHLPADWRRVARAGGLVVGDAYWDPARGTAAMVLGEPVRGPRGAMLGLLTAKLDLKGLEAILQGQTREGIDQLQVVTPSGMVLGTFPPREGGVAPASLPGRTAERLFSETGTPIEFVNVRGRAVVGALDATGRLGWGVLAEKERAREYAEVERVRNVTVLLAASILLGVGAAGYLLGLTLVRPLDRLIRGAGKVAGGDLDVDLPVYTRGEVGYLTVVFNRMVTRLRAAREEIEATNKALLDKNRELHELSITDGLTGLHNRKHMNETVAAEIARAQRHGHPISILMMDIDRFKEFNDARGHQAGDEVLRGVARVLKESVRATDYAARYGGEEFLVLLMYTGPEAAAGMAERIRARIEEAGLGREEGGRAITVSVGVAAFPENGSDAESVIREADVALYRAKEGGRNRVVAAARAPLAARRPVRS